MAIFTNTKNSYDVVACEGYDFETCGHYDAFIESASDDLSVMEAMHAFDMAEIEGLKKINALKESYADEYQIESAEADMEAALTESARDVFAKIKEKVKKLWEKIKAFFASIFRFIANLFQSNEQFLKSNGKALDKIRKDVEFTYNTYPKYDYGALEMMGAAGDVLKAYKLNDKFIGEIVSDIKDMGNVAVKNEEDEKALRELADEYADQIENQLDDMKKDEVYEGLRGGKDKKELTIKYSDVQVRRTYIGKATAIQKGLKSLRSSSDAAFNTVINAVNTAESTNESNSAVVYATNKASSILSKLQQKTTEVINVYISVAKEAAHEARAICLKAMTKSKA